MHKLKKILSSLIVLGVVAAVAIGLSSAFFSDTETSTGNILQAGELNLKIDNNSYYNGVLNAGTSWGLDDLPGHLFFDFHDLKPDDYGEDTISLHVQNDAWACMSITQTDDDDGTCTEPEKLDDPNCGTDGPPNFDGELGNNLLFAFWADDGDNVLEQGEDPNWKKGPASSLFDGTIWPLADAITNIWTGVPGPILGGQTKYIAKFWCFGTTATPNPLPVGAYPLGPAGDNDEVGGAGTPEDGGFTCDGSSLNNATQTDFFKADVVFTSDQARNNPGFLCQTCEETGLGWAAEVINNDQGTLKNGAAIADPNRTDPEEALGPNDWAVNTGTNFYSLGKNTSGTEGWVILKFSALVFDGTGDDLSVHEATNGRDSYPTESAGVEISLDGGTWYPVGTATSEPGGGGDGVSYFDISLTPLAAFQYVRITDTTDYTPHSDNADGYDLDAVDAVHECLD